MAAGNKTALVYGGTGAQGGAVVRHLLTNGRRVRVVTRNPNAVLPDGAEAVFGDLANAASLRRATAGADFVHLVLPLLYDRAQVTSYARNAVDAACAAGVSRFVLNTSVPLPDSPTGVAAFDIKLEVEAYLRASGLAHVVLRPTAYMGNLLGPWTAPAIVGQGVLAYPLPAELPVSWVSWEDVAAAVSEAFTSRDLVGKVLPIGGPEALTGRQVAEVLSEAVGREVVYQPIAPDAFEASLAANFGQDIAREIAAPYRWTWGQPSSPLVVGAKDGLPLLGPTTLRAWAKAQNWLTLNRAA